MALWFSYSVVITSSRGERGSCWWRSPANWPAKTNIGDSMPTGYWLPCPIHWLANSGLGTSPASTEKHFLFLIYIPFFSFNPYPTFICLHHPRHSVTNFLSFILIFILQFINQYNSSRLAIDFLDFILHLFPSTFLLFVWFPFILFILTSFHPHYTHLIYRRESSNQTNHHFYSIFTKYWHKPLAEARKRKKESSSLTLFSLEAAAATFLPPFFKHKMIKYNKK